MLTLPLAGAKAQLWTTNNLPPGCVAWWQAEGNALDQAKHVHFSCWLSPRKLRVEITDEGPGFNPAALPDPTDPACIDRPGGRGVMLMRAFMSHIEFHDRGNHVVLEKERGA